ncbi:MAG: ATP-binding protein [bacterium]
MNTQPRFSVLTFSLVYSITLAVMGGFIVWCDTNWNRPLAHTLADLLPLLIGPILYAAFSYPRWFYLSIIAYTLLAVGVILYCIVTTWTESILIMLIVTTTLLILCELVHKAVSKQRSTAEELRQVNEELESRVVQRTSELQRLNQELESDIALRNQTEQALQKSEMRLRAVLNAIPDGIVRIQLNGKGMEFMRIKDFSDSLFDQPQLHRSLWDRLPEDILQHLQAHVHKALTDKQPQLFEFQCSFQDSVYHYEVRIVILTENEVLAIFRDETERKRLEREILRISHREQNRIGRDLHDGLGQVLTGISCLLQGLSRKLGNHYTEGQPDVEEIANLVKQAISQTHGLSQGLMPVKLEDSGLIGALEELADQTQRIHGLPCHFQCLMPEVNHESAISVNLYRIAQEAVNNAVKYSQAKQITIRLNNTPDSLILSIEDDGVGLPENFERSGGLGLRIMNYRAGMIGAKLSIRSHPQAGTAILCALKHPQPDSRSQDKPFSQEEILIS